MTVRQILSESSNVGTITIAQRLGGPELASWIDRFGFGKRTGVDFPGESPGLVLPYEDWSGSTIGTVPIGQGIAVTPLQMVSAYAAIGNGGVDPPGAPHREGRRQEGAARQGTADRLPPHRRPDDRDVPRRRRRGHGHRGGDPGLHRGRQDGHREQGGERRATSPSTSRRSSVSCPARKPRLAILVMVDEPRGQIWGGVVAAPIFRDIARFALQYLEVPPDAPESKRVRRACSPPSAAP